LKLEIRKHQIAIITDIVLILIISLLLLDQSLPWRDSSLIRLNSNAWLCRWFKI